MFALNDLTPIAAAVIATTATIYVGPLLALAFLTLRRRRARAQRRSPMRRQLLRPAGHTLRQQLDEARSSVSDDVVMLMLLPLTVLTIFLAHGHLRGLERAIGTAWIYGGMTAGFIAFMVWRLWRISERTDRLRAGLDAEVAVGQELDQLMRQGAAVFHDVPAEGFNIDHVVVSSSGVFAIETKGYTKQVKGLAKANCRVSFDGKTLRFPGWTTSEPLEQAERQSAWLSRWLSSATGLPLRVQPVLALPGWYIERSGSHAVRAYSGAELSGLLREPAAQRLSAQELASAAHQIEQRCRTVELLYPKTG